MATEDQRIAKLVRAMRDAIVHITDYIEDDDPPLMDLELARDVLKRSLKEDG